MTTILSESMDKRMASEKLVEVLAHGFKVLVEVDGIEKARVAAAMYRGDDNVAWITVDDIPVYRAVLLPSIREDHFVIEAFGTWLPSYRQFLVEVDAPDLELADFRDDEDTSPGEPDLSDVEPNPNAN